jgi:hypothetical protein
MRRPEGGLDTTAESERMGREEDGTCSSDVVLPRSAVVISACLVVTVSLPPVSGGTVQHWRVAITC